MSVSRFGRVFRRTMGTTFAKFSLRVRLGYATHLLRDTDMALVAIADASGFSHASHLHREFTKRTGRTPGQYRRAQKAQHAGEPQ